MPQSARNKDKVGKKNDTLINRGMPAVEHLTGWFNLAVNLVQMQLSDGGGSIHGYAVIILNV